MNQYPTEDEPKLPEEGQVEPVVAEETTPAEVVEEAEAVEAEPVEAPTGEPNPRLIVKRGGQETDQVFPFTAPAVIGRFDPDRGPVDIDLGTIPEGVYVSRKHAKIVCEDGVYKIEDMGSSNGTYVLGQDFEKVESAEIVDGTEIALGNARFIFRIN